MSDDEAGRPGRSALLPGVLWIIVGLDGDEAEVRTWRIDDGRVTDAELIVE